VVTKPVDPGLLTVLRDNIVPRLKDDVSQQPSSRCWAAIPRLPRFTLVFDRAGYSPSFFEAMWKERVAIITYHKVPGAPWDNEDSSCSGSGSFMVRR